jgi:membrane protease YdiL (CAAX protease family)
VVLGLLWGLPFSTLGWLVVRGPVAVGWGVGVGLVLTAFFYGVTQWLVRHTGERFYSSVLLRYIVPRNGREMALVCLALIPAVLLEEVLFRSLWIGGFSPLLAPEALLVISSVIFGLFHSPQGLWGILGTGIAGVVFGLLFLWTGGLLVPLVAHYVVNVVQIGLAWQTNPVQPSPDPPSAHST